MNTTTQTTPTSTPASRCEGLFVLLIFLSLPLLPLLFILCTIESATQGAFSRALRRGL